MSISQTFTESTSTRTPEKDKLASQFVGQKLTALRTPALVIDRRQFANNCAGMHRRAEEWGASFRAHIKTHKTVEGVRMQLVSEGGRSSAIVVSTVAEAWYILPLAEEGIVKDILYGLPIGVNKIADLARFADTIAQYGAVLRLLIDHEDQVRALDAFDPSRRWYAFIKVNGGDARAGLVPSSPEFSKLLDTIIDSSSAFIYGLYTHAGMSYASQTEGEAASFLSREVLSVNDAAKRTMDALAKRKDKVKHAKTLILSVGSTPTAHAASPEVRARLEEELHGKLELHAGNYAMLDLQQLDTGMIDRSQIAQSVLSTVISVYSRRGDGGLDEALCDAGGIAMSKDTGRRPHFGEVKGKEGWVLARMSQEHGILAGPPGGAKVGDQVEIIGQHACMIAAAHPWYYIGDGGDEVVDIWIPCKGW